MLTVHVMTKMQIQTTRPSALSSSRLHVLKQFIQFHQYTTLTSVITVTQVPTLQALCRMRFWQYMTQHNITSINAGAAREPRDGLGFSIYYDYSVYECDGVCQYACVYFRHWCCIDSVRGLAVVDVMKDYLCFEAETRGYV